MDRLTVAVHTTAPDTDEGEEEKEQQADEVGKPHTGLWPKHEHSKNVLK